MVRALYANFRTIDVSEASNSIRHSLWRPHAHSAHSNFNSHVALPQAANALGMALPAPKASAQEEEAPADLTAASKANMHPQAMDAGVRYSEADINRYEQDGDTIATLMQ